MQNMYMSLFDEEQIMKNHDASLTRKVTAKNTLDSIISIMNNLAFSADKAMDVLNIPQEDREYYKSLL